MSEPVKRYTLAHVFPPALLEQMPEIEICRQETPDGYFVIFDDYAKLEAVKEACSAKLDAWKRLGTLYLRGYQMTTEREAQYRKDLESAKEALRQLGEVR